MLKNYQGSISKMLESHDYKSATQDLLDIDHEYLSTAIVNALALNGPFAAISKSLVLILETIKDKIDENDSLKKATKNQLKGLHTYIDKEIYKAAELSWNKLSNKDKNLYHNHIYEFTKKKTELLKSLEQLIEKVDNI